ncbi:MAG: 2-C-methyl-D-erythritol 4-phosphate cytidylyltransferase [Salinivirgaceae bacterium]|nr:2-C-methyl-D-erythritol 4-phosphate cytidylyltransferase [Salinivirgaceae bacterium]
MSNYALIFAGGVGNRMNTLAKPKQFLQLYGKEIIIHTLENFQDNPNIDGIVVVCKENWIEFLNKLLKKYDVDKVKWVVPGGESGQLSIYNGLCELERHIENESIVLVHDGVRPFVTNKLINDCIESVERYGSAITVVPAIETIVSIENDEIQTITERSKCYHAKAPQCFYFGELIAAHRKALQEEITNMIDSASLMKYFGHSLHTVSGNYDNIKITTPTDYYTSRALYEVRENQQIFGL